MAPIHIKNFICGFESVLYIAWSCIVDHHIIVKRALAYRTWKYKQKIKQLHMQHFDPCKVYKGKLRWVIKMVASETKCKIWLLYTCINIS